jgi:hypothetical protein
LTPVSRGQNLEKTWFPNRSLLAFQDRKTVKITQKLLKVFVRS